MQIPVPFVVVIFAALVACNPAADSGPPSGETLGDASDSAGEGVVPEAGSTETDDEVVDDGGGADEWDDCHYDCFGHLKCVDGVVTKYAHLPVPCEYWDGQCPVEETYVCEAGCEVGFIDDPSADVQAACVCESDSDCLSPDPEPGDAG